MPRQVEGNDHPLLQNWFKKGYSSREMAMFLLLADMANNPGYYQSFRDRVENVFSYYHDEVLKIVYQK